MKPFRIYEYDCGGLRKFDAYYGSCLRCRHDHETLEQAEANIELFLSRKVFDCNQLVLVEYTEPYKSKILKIFN